MFSISSHSADIQDSQAHERIKVLEAEVKRLTSLLTWEDKLFSNPHLSATHKLVLRTTRQKVSTSNSKELTKIFLPAIANKTGLSTKTTGRSLKYLAHAGALIRKAETVTSDTGERKTHLFIGLTEDILQPDKIQPIKPRNHGGKRSACPSCGSEQLLEEKKVICTDCGEVITHLSRPVNKEPTEDQDGRRCINEEDVTTQQCPATSASAPPCNNIPADKLSPLKPKEPEVILSHSTLEKPPSPPGALRSALPSAVSPAQDLLEERHQPEEQERGEQLRKAEILYLDIAGDTPEHIMMPGTNGKKYTTIHSPLTRGDIREHLEGKKTIGASLQHTDGTTRALCFDADTDKNWQVLKTSAHLLVANGYKPLLEQSPAGRGGHLWIIFSERVNTEAAYNEIYKVAPLLKDISEYWPARANQKVRLPAGKYVTPGITSWTSLIDATGCVLSESGTQAAAILLSHQTLATLAAPIVSKTLTPGAVITPQSREHSHISDQHSHSQRTTPPDEEHRRKYGAHTMWVEWPSEQYLINRFNSQYSIDDLAKPERNGMVNATIIGRPERTASVGVTRDGKHFTDFGAGARNPDGTQDGGDAFEFYIRSEGKDKSDVLRQLGQALNKEASQEILHAARVGELPPSWVMDIITDTGRNIYNRNALRHGHKTLEEHTGGLAGFSGLEKKREQGIPEDFIKATPCEQCGCALCRDMAGYTACIRCYPARGYHLYSDLVDALYPRKNTGSFSKD